MSNDSDAKVDITDKVLHHLAEILNEPPVVGREEYRAAMYRIHTRAVQLHKVKLFRVVKIRDEFMSFADHAGDSFNPQVNVDIPPHILKKQEAKERARYYRLGMWGMTVELVNPLTGEWTELDDLVPDQHAAIWGFVGDDAVGSGYDGELLSHAAEYIQAHTDDYQRYVASELAKWSAVQRVLTRVAHVEPTAH